MRRISTIPAAAGALAAALALTQCEPELKPEIVKLAAMAKARATKLTAGCDATASSSSPFGGKPAVIRPNPEMDIFIITKPSSMSRQSAEERCTTGIYSHPVMADSNQINVGTTIESTHQMNGSELRVSSTTQTDRSGAITAEESRFVEKGNNAAPNEITVQQSFGFMKECKINGESAPSSMCISLNQAAVNTQNRVRASLQKAQTLAD